MTDFDNLNQSEQTQLILDLEHIIKTQMKKIPQIITKKELFEHYKISEQYKCELRYYSLFPEHKKTSKELQELNLVYFRSILARYGGI